MFLCFSLNSMSAERRTKWKLFLKIHHKNLYARHFSFVRATCLTKHFELYLTTRRLQCTTVSRNISSCKLQSSSVNSTVSRRNTITLSGIKMHCLYIGPNIKIIRTNFSVAGYVRVTVD